MGDKDKKEIGDTTKILFDGKIDEVTGKIEEVFKRRIQIGEWGQ